MNNIEKIKFLVGNKKFQKATIAPYDKTICDFLSNLSDELNSCAETKNYPDIKTLAFYCRKANLESLKKNFLLSSNELRLGLGLIFHITPANIPTNFAYSLIFGLLTGNSNIVKVPSRKFRQVEIICKSINKKQFQSVTLSGNLSTYPIGL